MATQRLVAGLALLYRTLRRQSENTDSIRLPLHQKTEPRCTLMEIRLILPDIILPYLEDASILVVVSVDF
jgi:hypothetical protein